MDTPRQVLRNSHLQNVQQLSTPLKLPASPFLKNLGYGTGVNVYRLERSPKMGQLRSPWAVKRVSQRMKTHAEADVFNARIQKEAELLRKLSHPNIVGFRSITRNADTGLDTLALECCKTSLGSILEERHEDDLGALPAKETLKMIVDISHGLDYLHTTAKLLHGDLKSFNVLVKGDFEICKLCDFGVSLPLDDNGVVLPDRNYIGTDIWSAPEVIDESDVIDCKADIFSFGLVIYETIALVPPHTLEVALQQESKNEENNENSFDEANDESLDEYLEQMDSACGTRPPLPEAFNLTEEYNCIVELFYCCTNELSEDRPTARAIWQSLEKDETH